MNVTKIELCTRVAKRLEKNIATEKQNSIRQLSTTDHKTALESLIDEIFVAMAEGHRIEIRGFGCFKPVTRKKRIGRNPRTGEVVEIPAYTAPCFKFSREARKIFDEKLLAIKTKPPVIRKIPSGPVKP
jgi:integration host factor subunit beta